MTAPRDDSHDGGLLPCPHCGGPAGMQVAYSIHDEAAYAPTCYVDGCGATLGEYGSDEEAVAAWNRRAAPPAPDAAAGVDVRERLEHLFDLGSEACCNAAGYSEGSEQADRHEKAAKVEASALIEELVALLARPPQPQAAAAGVDVAALAARAVAVLESHGRQLPPGSLHAEGFWCDCVYCELRLLARPPQAAPQGGGEWARDIRRDAIALALSELPEKHIVFTFMSGSYMSPVLAGELRALLARRQEGT
jgi:hypothetical protein